MLSFAIAERHMPEFNLTVEVWEDNGVVVFLYGILGTHNLIDALHGCHAFLNAVASF